MKPELMIVIGPIMTIYSLWIIQRNGGNWWHYVCAACGVVMTLDGLFKIAKRDSK
jgi:hypothetical protein